MRCGRVQKRLNAYLDDALDAEARSALEGHLRSCAACRRALNRLKEVARVLAASQTPAVPEGFAARVMARAAVRVVAPRPAAIPVWTPLGWWRTASLPMRLAAALLVAAGLALGALAGHTAAVRPLTSEAQTAQADPVALYRLDSLSATPAGSVAEALLTLTGPPNAGGQ